MTVPIKCKLSPYLICTAVTVDIALSFKKSSKASPNFLLQQPPVLLKTLSVLKLMFFW